MTLSFSFEKHQGLGRGRRKKKEGVIRGVLRVLHDEQQRFRQDQVETTTE